MPASKRKISRRNLKKPELFKSEEVIADASLPVQELLQSALSRPTFQAITSAIKSAKHNPYLRLSDAKNKVKSLLIFKPVRKK